MTRERHTPGPWKAFYKHKYDEWHVSLPVAGSGMKMALCRDGIQSENREADARLIAAAPTMLAALKECLGLAEIAATLTGCRSDDDYVQGIRETIEAAISRAESTPLSGQT